MHGCDIIYIKGPDLRHRLGIRMLLYASSWRQAGALVARLCRMKFIISRGWLYANYPDNNSDHAIYPCNRIVLLSIFLVSLNIIGHANVRGEEEIISLSPISCNVYWLGTRFVRIVLFWSLCSCFEFSNSYLAYNIYFPTLFINFLCKISISWIIEFIQGDYEKLIDHLLKYKTYGIINILLYFLSLSLPTFFILNINFSR